MRYLLYFFLMLICLYSCISEQNSITENNVDTESATNTASHELKQVTDNTKGLIIETDPLNAKVYINNTLYDTSPCTVKHLDYGIYYLTIKKEGSVLQIL